MNGFIYFYHLFIGDLLGTGRRHKGKMISPPYQELTPLVVTH